MPRDHEPTELELARAKRREALQAVEAWDRVIAVLERGLDGHDSDMAPRGCDRRVDGIDCSPRLFRRVCTLHGCGEVFRLCARHGGEKRALEALTRHQYQAHRVDDREGGDE